MLTDAKEAKDAASEASAEPAAAAILHDSRRVSGTDDAHSQPKDAEPCASTAAIDCTLATDQETAGMGSTSPKRNDVPARLQQAQYLFLDQISEDDRKPWLEQQAAEQSNGKSQHAVSSVRSPQQEPSLQPCRVAAQPHAASLLLQRDCGGAPGMGAQQASRAGARGAPAALPASLSSRVARQSRSLAQQAAPFSSPRAAVGPGQGSASGGAKPPQPVALADSTKDPDQPAASAANPGNNVADRARLGSGLSSGEKCGVAGEEGLNRYCHAASQAEEGARLDRLDSQPQRIGSAAHGIDMAAAVGQEDADVGNQELSIRQAENQRRGEIRVIGVQDIYMGGQESSQVEDGYTWPSIATGPGTKQQIDPDRLPTVLLSARISDDGGSLSQKEKYDEQTCCSNTSSAREQQAAPDRLSTDIGSAAVSEDTTCAPASRSQQEDELSSRMRCFLDGLKGGTAVPPDPFSIAATSASSAQAAQGFATSEEMHLAKVT